MTDIETTTLARNAEARGARRSVTDPSHSERTPWRIARRRGPGPQPLSPLDFATAEAFAELMLEKLEATGLKITIESDFAEFVRLRLGASPETPMNTTYDPARVDLSLIDAFWFRATDAAGNLVAMIAHRAFDSADLLADIATVKLWHDRAAP